MADAQRARGQIIQAETNYARALTKAEQTGDQEVAKSRQKCQFLVHRDRYHAGLPAAEDPLFDCQILAGHVPPGPIRPCGRFSAHFNHLGITIAGAIRNRRASRLQDELEILINGQPIRQFKMNRAQGAMTFSVTIKRPTLDQFPEASRLEVRRADGAPLMAQGTLDLITKVPHGNGKLLCSIARRGMLDKKGYLPPLPEEVRARQDAYLALYAAAREFFDNNLGRPLFLMYGTLLGLYRDGDLIPHDDDFDVGYISEHEDPHAIKMETREIILKLLRAGFTVAVNRRGRPFRLRNPSTGAELHLDVRPVWYQDKRVWAHKQACLALPLEGFRQVERRTLRGTAVYIPRDAEKFLEAYYGHTWTTPDPGYTNSTRLVPRSVKAHLSATCFNPNELRQLSHEVDQEREHRPEMGELIAIGLTDLYPLEQYHQRCGI
ncbi:LicD family protein [Halorhodospira halochloris]|uniref:LicD family protein n=1 Tax=Halorhodospira halochloris TaxID=1052 RepID=UPI001EE8E1DA|nr:LicD family protein [Halorhodospira halochloris]MCG5529703.1 LicD family protein [Halorhodospira halochloris]